MLMSNLEALVADANMLAEAAVEGKLATRADASKHQGDYRKIVQGVNDTLDAVIGPLNAVAETIIEVGRGRSDGANNRPICRAISKSWAKRSIN